MRKNYARRLQASSDVDPIIRLWVFRILVELGGYRKFLESDGFENDTVAEMLGLGHWIDPFPKEFDQKAVYAELRGLHQKAEKQLASMAVTECWSSLCRSRMSAYSTRRQTGLVSSLR